MTHTTTDAAEARAQAAFRTIFNTATGTIRTKAEAQTALSLIAGMAKNRLATAEAASEAVVTAATATDDQLRRIQLLADVELHLKSCRIFLTSREKMHPCGIELHDELLANVTAAIEQEGCNG